MGTLISVAFPNAVPREGELIQRFRSAVLEVFETATSFRLNPSLLSEGPKRLQATASRVILERIESVAHAVPLGSFSFGTITAGRISRKTEPGAKPLPIRR
ncbi:MAG: hypothetical protein EBU59_12910 [Planctomycetia bacterium]|nr:hypothetical protein [Planctomycetia bacterium]